jgi:hypothetical protein
MVEIDNGSCTGRDSSTSLFHKWISLNLGNDTSLCGTNADTNSEHCRVIIHGVMAQQ